MISNEILDEKYRTQRRLSQACGDIHDYFKRCHDSAVALSKQHGFPLKYGRLPRRGELSMPSLPSTEMREPDREK